MEKTKAQRGKMNTELLLFRVANLFLVSAMVVFFSVKYTYFFETCDDSLIRDISSGSYSGMPEIFNAQTLFFWGAISKMLYLCFPRIEWFSLLLLICQYGCLLLASDRICVTVTGKLRKIVSLLAFYTTVIAFFGERLFIIQYTVTSAMLGGTACFLTLTSKSREYNDDQSLSKHILKTIEDFAAPLTLLLMAYNLRSEMLLLLFPFWGLALVTRWFFVKGFWNKNTLISFLAVLFFAISLLGVSELGDRIYSRVNGYEEFRDFFNARTDLYDFSKVYLYSEANGFYDSIGISEEQYKLLERKNFGLDQKITGEIFSEVGDYYIGTVKESSSLGDKIKDSLAAYRHRFEAKRDRPYIVVIIAIYLTVAAIGICCFLQKEFAAGIKTFAFLCLEICGRSLLWMFLLWRGRYPDRITDSMGFAEVMLLMGALIFFVEKTKRRRKEVFERILQGIPSIAFLTWLLALTLYTVPFQIKGYKIIADNELVKNSHYYELLEYFENNSGNFYWIDTITTMNYRERLSTRRKTEIENFDTLGNWITNSPIAYKKMSYFEFEDICSSLFLDNVYFVIDSEDDAGWMATFLSMQESDRVTVEKIDSVANDFSVYKCVRK